VAADLIGVLGQAATDLANNEITVYTVPAGRVAVLSTVAICNTSTATTYRIYIRRGGITYAGTIAPAYAIAYDVPLGANQTDALTWGITLAAGDAISAMSASARCSYAVFGEETDTPT
jgi:hypothetical protein